MFSSGKRTRAAAGAGASSNDEQKRFFKFMFSRLGGGKSADGTRNPPSRLLVNELRRVFHSKYKVRSEGKFNARAIKLDKLTYDFAHLLLAGQYTESYPSYSDNGSKFEKETLGDVVTMFVNYNAYFNSTTGRDLIAREQISEILKKHIQPLLGEVLYNEDMQIEDAESIMKAKIAACPAALVVGLSEHMDLGDPAEVKHCDDEVVP